jgi:hypothetical protein
LTEPQLMTITTVQLVTNFLKEAQSVFYQETLQSTM